MEKPKFKKGDLVWFHPYEKKCKCKIVEVNVKSHLFYPDQDDRVFYRITGEAVSITTDKCLSARI